MARSYPIWNEVTACIYNSSKSWGARKCAGVDVKVGTSARNSHAFVTHKTTHRELADGSREFRFYVDGECIRRAVLAKGADALTFINQEEPTND